MAPQRLSHLQRRILNWLQAHYQRTHGTTSASHHELAKYLLDIDKGNLSRSLRNLERKGHISMLRGEGGLSESIILHNVVNKG